MPSSSRRELLVGTGSGLAGVLGGCLSESCEPQVPGTGRWAQPGGDPQHTGADVTLDGISDGDDHWRHSYESTFEPAGVAVLDERIVIAGRHQSERGLLHVRSLQDGELVESVDLPTPVTAPPVLSERWIVVTCRLSDRRACHRVLSYDGEEQWAVERGAPFSAPTIDRSTIYGGGPNGTVFALDAVTGDLQWERTIEDGRQGGAVSAPVTVDESTVYVPVSSSSERGIYALSRADGHTQWKIGGPRIRSMLVRTGSALLVSYPAHELVAFDSHSGERQWSETLAERRISPPAATGETVVISDAGTLYGLDEATGTPEWTLACDPDPHTQPVIAGDTVIVRTSDGLVGCSVSDGERRWTVDSGSALPVVPVEHGFLYAPERDTLAAYTGCQHA